MKKRPRHPLITGEWEPRILRSLLAVFVLLMLPGTYPASRTPVELMSFTWDEIMFMIPALGDLLETGRAGFYTYGNFPAYFTAGLFAPVLLAVGPQPIAASILHLAVLMRFAQVAVAVIGLYYLYRLARHFCSAGTALFIIALMLSCATYCKWTLTLHPDIFQTAMIWMAAYYLVRYYEKASTRTLQRCAFATAAAMASKFWGVFLWPVVALAIAQHPQRLSWNDRVLAFLRFTGLSLAVFALFNLELLLNFQRYAAMGWEYAQSHGFKLVEAGEFLSIKVAILSSPEFFGASFFLLYVLATVFWAYQRLRDRQATLSALDLVQGVIFTALGFYLFFFNDPVNLPSSERYMLPFVGLMAVVVGGYGERFAKTFSQRKIAQGLLILLLLSQGLRLTGISHATVRLGQSDLLGHKNVISLRQVLSNYYFKEDTGRFLVQDWIRKNVPPQATVYAESYMNVPSDLPIRRLDVDLFILPKQVQLRRPDFVITKRPDIADMVINQHPYDVTAVLGESTKGRVIVLRRKRGA